MYSIGDFSKLCMVTTKTLRHYDSIGLLRPAYQNEQTGYRYYEVGQLRDMLLIIKLKGYGFSLEQIRQVLETPSMLLSMLQQKQKEQSALLEKQGQLLHQIKNDLEQLKKGKSIMDTNVKIKIVEREAVEIVGARDIISINNFSVLFGRLYDKIHQQKLTPAGAPIAIYYSREFDPNETDIEVAVPVAQKTGDTRLLAGGKCAMLLHEGSYSTLNQTYAALAEWIEKNGHQIANPPYEIYLNDPKDTKPEDLKTEVYFPLA